MQAVGSRDYFAVLPKDVSRIIAKEVVKFPGRKNIDAFSVTSKANYDLVKKNRAWELSATVAQAFRKSYANGLRALHDNPYTVTDILSLFTVATIVYSLLGPKVLVPPAATAAGVKILQNKIFSYDKTIDRTYIDGLAAWAIFGFTAWKMETLGPCIISIPSFLILHNMIKERKLLLYDAKRLALVLLPFIGLALHPVTPWPINAILVAPIGLEFDRIFLIYSNGACAKKMCGTTYGTKSAVKEIYSWTWNIGIPKLKRGFLG